MRICFAVMSLISLLFSAKAPAALKLIILDCSTPSSVTAILRGVKVEVHSSQDCAQRLPASLLFSGACACKPLIPRVPSIGFQEYPIFLSPALLHLIFRYLEDSRSSFPSSFGAFSRISPPSQTSNICEMPFSKVFLHTNSKNGSSA